jgi:hypothetical protein
MEYIYRGHILNRYFDALVTVYKPDELKNL